MLALFGLRDIGADPTPEAPAVYQIIAWLKVDGFAVDVQLAVLDHMDFEVRRMLNQRAILVHAGKLGVLAGVDRADARQLAV